jgi:hypothetical protein
MRRKGISPEECNLSFCDSVLWVKKQPVPENQSPASEKEEENKMAEKKTTGFSFLLRRNALCGHDAENDGREKGGAGLNLFLPGSAYLAILACPFPKTYGKPCKILGTKVSGFAPLKRRCATD